VAFFAPRIFIAAKRAIPIAYRRLSIVYPLT